ncbi:MAG: peptidylprolyl isomerase [Proteobacteria bacterium]|jgi:parvulin-like peptidyl-prolyl isomerase|nr:peptidylprolyl isomerase [Pseudomonadota bacterium]
MRRARRNGGWLAICAVLCACGDDKAPRAPERETAATAVADGADEAADRAERPRGEPAPRSNQRLAASNILVAYAGAEKAAPAVTRTKDEAKALAEGLYARVRAGEDFGALADRYSDGPERGHAGRLGVFTASKMLPAIAKTVAGLDEGAVAPPVESGMGFHVIRRDKIEEIFAAMIVVSFQGAQNAPAGVTRSRDEARKVAGEVIAAARAPGAAFSDVAMKHSDHLTRERGGYVGRVFRGLFPPALDAVAFSLAPGEIGGPLEMVNGFTIVRRLPEAFVRHVLVAFEGARNAPTGVTRSREDAAALAAEVLEKLKRGDDFAGVAAKYSDCPSKAEGGDLGVVAEGTMTPRFEAAVFSLAPGARSGVVETEFGFHVLERLR